MTSLTTKVVVVAAAAACLSQAAGCAPHPESTATKASPAAPISAGAPVQAGNSIAGQCRRAMESIQKYATVAGQNPIVIIPSDATSPETIETVKTAASKAAGELRDVAGGVTDESVAAPLRKSISLLDEDAAGQFTMDQEFLPVDELFKGCVAAAPELADDKDFRIDINTDN